MAPASVCLPGSASLRSPGFQILARRNGPGTTVFHLAWVARIATLTAHSEEERVTTGDRDIAIVTDSTCDIPPELLSTYGIATVPLYVLWGDDQLRDGVDIDQETFFSRLPDDPIHPKTSQPTPGDFVRVIEKQEAREVLIITLSKALSGTHESACQAREEVDVPVRVVDSCSLSMGLGWQVLAAARAREEGGDIEAMIAAADGVREKTSVFLTLDTLEYLHRGGRIGTVAKFLGSVVQLKPLLSVDHDEGVLEPVERIRTRRRALQRVVEATFSRVDPNQPTHAAVLHGAAPEDARALLHEVLKRCERVETVVSAITPVLGVHGGPGTVGIAAYND
jgi:DegV family protein with EDD domain